mmetsp:Transcript_89795/g.239930  ORF Transcript_89795/g.239930 Transcript_89795/m.239930 type:complete len:160 (-) Transcript_89795:783-1262(-)
MYPQNFYIGLDKKGSRLWAGICEAESKGLINVAFIRGDISLLESYFGPHELDEIWITFPEPQPGGETSRAKARNRVTSAEPGLARLHRILRGGGLLHLKTDSHLLYRYTLDQVRKLRRIKFYAPVLGVWVFATRKAQGILTAIADPHLIDKICYRDVNL